MLKTAVGALFAGLTVAATCFIEPDNTRRAAIIVGVVGFWAILLLPALRYPRNPPGVGEAATLACRQGFQLAFLALSALSSLGLLAIAGVGVAYLAVAGLLYAVFPANPDPVHAPADLVREFRILTIAGHSLLWTVVVAGTLAWSGRQREPQRVDRGAARG